MITDSSLQHAQPLVEPVRAYFAPVDRRSGEPAVFDPSRGAFDPEFPPAPWIDLGPIENLSRATKGDVQLLRAGRSSSPRVLSRKCGETRVQLDFTRWGKLQLAISSGSQHFNVLSPVQGSAGGGSGAPAEPACPLLAGTSASELVIGADALPKFSAGDLVAVDDDYEQQIGYVGTPISGAFVDDAQRWEVDADYTRRVTFNLARVAEKTETSLKLDRPLPGGTPGAEMRVQKVIGFVDRDFGAFVQEWSALFVMKERWGGRVCLYYPRLQTAEPGSETPHAIGEDLRRLMLHASFVAMPVRDCIDAEETVCYRTYFPASAAAGY